MTNPAPLHMFNIAPGASFLATLARAILAGNFPQAGRAAPGPLDLSKWRIYVPTRRAASLLRDEFIRQAGPMLLPAITPLGDPEEDELVIAGPEFPGLPPAISPLARRLALTELVMGWAKAAGEWDKFSPDARPVPETPAQAAALAGELAKLMDSIEIEEADWSQLRDLVPDKYARNWQLTLEFLKIVTVEWPRHLKELGLTSPMARRNALIKTRGQAFLQNPPDDPVIAAGSTGSTPATAELLGIIASLPSGAVVLPGLDTGLDDKSWAAIGPDHPQYGMRQLLRRLDADRGQVRTLPGASQDRAMRMRERLISEFMRPAEMTHCWAATDMKPQDISSGIENITLIEATDPEAEANAIALIMREALEHEGRTAALVTPERSLARRVAAALARWDIEVEDSAGRPLRSTPAGAFFLLAVQAIAADFASVELLALIKHGLFSNRSGERAVNVIDLALRGARPAPGLSGIRAVLEQSEKGADDDYVHPAIRRLSPDDWKAGRELLDDLENSAGSLMGLAGEGGEIPLGHLVAAHVEMAQALAGAEEENPLWRGDAGEALVQFIAQLHEAASLRDMLEFRHYAAFLESLMNEIPVRPRTRTHPRLHIWGTLEARLQRADILIMGGLNENVWPAQTRTDPWLSRPMREGIKLEPLERRIGLSAHDFTQSLSAPKVYLTRASKADGSPTVPSRWLLRMQAFLQGFDLEDALGSDKETPWMEWALALDAPDELRPAPAPTPRPPLEARPKHLSVTRIEAWIRDPYEIYAANILKLKPLDGLDMVPGALDKGILIHKIMELFTETEPQGPLGPGALERLRAIADREFEILSDRPDLQAWWLTRFKDIAAWFIAFEKEARKDGPRIYPETSGKMIITGPLEDFTLTARADRIDVFKDGRAIIRDYKTGGHPTKREVAAGLAPQLPLEAAMLAAGAFQKIDPAAEIILIYLQLSGGNRPGKEIEVSAPGVVEKTLGELENAVALYQNPDTPYWVRIIPKYENRYRDYDHLARTKEWRLLDEGGGS